MINRYVALLRTQLKRWGFRSGMKNLIYHILYRERKKRFGPQNPDVTFYVIRGVKSDSRFYLGVDLNLLANYSYVLSHVLYAKERGWHPVVDQLNYPVYNKEQDKINGSDNPWEYFWQQPGSVTLDEVYQSRNVILSKRSWYAPGNPEYSISQHRDPAVIGMLHDLSQMVPLNQPTQDYVQEKLGEVFGNRKRILGVATRGAGHTKGSALEAAGHPIQPPVGELMDVVEQRLQEWKMDYVFLTTEENETLRIFRERFGEKLLYCSRERYNGWRFFTKEDPNPLYLPGRKFYTTRDYLTEMELLAGCDSLIGSITSGLRYAIVRNNGRYEYLELLDYGRFPAKGR